MMQKILVIDDEEPLRRLIQLALRKRGYEVIEADNGDTGMELARSKLPDLVLCDVRMAKTDGYMTLNALRNDPVTAAIPFILMTGRPDNAGMRQGMIQGADDYLPKPFTIPELVAAVQARLKKQEAVRQQAEQKLADLRANITLALPHELFTPLSGIMGFAEIISMDPASLKADEIAEIGKAIHDSSQRLYRLIENFLLYAQIELLKSDTAGLQSLRSNWTDNTHELVESRAREIAQKTDRLPDLHLDLQPAGACILEEYLKKILLELLDNAFKFSTKGTPVVASSGPCSEGYRFSVMDKGLGMTPKQIADIGAYMQFERKLHEQQGSGLGLAIAKRFSELHGGSLSIQSAPEDGSTVTVILPSKR
ncbi:MAG TPA: hybrid sensor histidine kinase/response regulator [Candidatus Paceibacterota bacterium]|nr:hybrid sensor histidine kinase/response regulator [Verrucomicrobiota bacterium]HRY47065.1 hybrid sensor histidine kinase/response regulator [Candidatus Paceibacterota bacterium]